MNDGFRVALMFAVAGGIILFAGLLFALAEKISRDEELDR